MSTRSIGLFGCVAIPVGHRVEVYVLTRDQGIFSTDVRPDPREPLVRDLDTGVYYGRGWHFGTVGDGVGTLAPRVPHPPKGVTVAERFSGRVTNCIVWTDGQTEKYHAATTLEIELDPAAPPGVGMLG
ncbi:MAG: hypothetical protein U0234_11070 [Sandaracinus sp.]